MATARDSDHALLLHCLGNSWGIVRGEDKLHRVVRINYVRLNLRAHMVSLLIQR